MMIGGLMVSMKIKKIIGVCCFKVLYCGCWKSLVVVITGVRMGVIRE